ncbi:membrane protein ORF65 [Anguillid herpesvirus 1]|uniref:Membrane protein ORF65 n=1 Tax=Anguillid herpesvirus 1 TaxID=150286 RepID=A0A1J0REI7_9VIRU|nr:membrane protein ORF65 [Anguillid herpesvirus 1]ADA57828.2 membrane protein ORF65 [Anguillid herpesvirus 1]APD76228.1 membrane protein ORF65 [Anguillid herpesvirus 1]QRM16359.1 membrane protein ORF65 [Anguillid herpesvirus 1]QRM16488.1 membrane protein ORF65 [Anguillid herpesvirus 1]QRM16618.1 membrane protein ORF65 [Anguillid herpesvirus 1]
MFVGLCSALLLLVSAVSEPCRAENVEVCAAVRHRDSSVVMTCKGTIAIITVHADEEEVYTWTKNRFRDRHRGGMENDGVRWGLYKGDLTLYVPPGKWDAYTELTVNSSEAGVGVTVIKSTEACDTSRCKDVRCDARSALALSVRTCMSCPGNEYDETSYASWGPELSGCWICNPYDGQTQANCAKWNRWWCNYDNGDVTCQRHTQCTSEEYVVKQGDESSDTKCEPITDCTGLFDYEYSAATATSDTGCHKHYYAMFIPIVLLIVGALTALIVWLMWYRRKWNEEAEKLAQQEEEEFYNQFGDEDYVNSSDDENGQSIVSYDDILNGPSTVKKRGPGTAGSRRTLRTLADIEEARSKRPKRFRRRAWWRKWESLPAVSRRTKVAVVCAVLLCLLCWGLASLLDYSMNVVCEHLIDMEMYPMGMAVGLNGIMASHVAALNGPFHRCKSQRGRYIPGNTDLSTALSCTQEYHETKRSAAATHSENKETETRDNSGGGGSVGFAVAAFSGSASAEVDVTKEVKHAISAQVSQSTSTTAIIAEYKCTVGRLGFSGGKTVYTHAFLSAANALNAKEITLDEFTDLWGVGFVAHVEMGGMFYRIMTVGTCDAESASRLDETMQDCFKSEFAASGGGWGVTAEAHGHVDKCSGKSSATEKGIKLSKFTKNMFTLQIGGGTVSTDMSDWQHSLKDDPKALQYKLVPYTMLKDVFSAKVIDQMKKVPRKIEGVLEAISTPFSLTVKC